MGKTICIIKCCIKRRMRCKNYNSTLIKFEINRTMITVLYIGIDIGTL